MGGNKGFDVTVKTKGAETEATDSGVFEDMDNIGVATPGPGRCFRFARIT